MIPIITKLYHKCYKPFSTRTLYHKVPK